MSCTMRPLILTYLIFFRGQNPMHMIWETHFLEKNLIVTTIKTARFVSISTMLKTKYQRLEQNFKSQSTILKEANPYIQNIIFSARIDTL